MKKLILISAIFATSSVLAQISGNEVYQRDNANYNYNYNYGNTSGTSKFTHANVISTDSTITISAQVLMNKPADHYVLSIGVSQQGESVEECNAKINGRIQKFIEDLKDLEIDESKVYIDFITQNKVYDYKVEGNQATQILDGFEIKKNVMMEINDVTLLDQITMLASKHKIYDIIKVDYIDENIEKTYQELFEKSLNLINLRKQMYTKASNMEFTGKSRVLSDHFEAIYPKTQYKHYQAYESSSVKDSYNYNGKNFIKKEARKSETYYYDGTSPAAFDAIVNPVQTKVGIQYIMELKVVYEIKK